MVTINEIYEILGAPPNKPFLSTERPTILSESSLPRHKKFYYAAQLGFVRIPLFVIKGSILYLREKMGYPHSYFDSDSTVGAIDETPLLGILFNRE